MFDRIFQLSKYPGDTTRTKGHTKQRPNDTDSRQKPHDPSEDYEKLNSLHGIEVDSGNSTMTIASKEQYFIGKYTKFKKTIATLENMTLDDFCAHKNAHDITRLGHMYFGKYGFCVDGQKDPMTLDRLVQSAEDGDRYYINDVLR